MVHYVEHSGTVWICLGAANSFGRETPVWPIAEYLARTNHRPNVAERIRRLNPNGKPEGDSPRGWHPTQWEKLDMTFTRGYSPLGALVRKRGRSILTKIPANEIVKRGRRKYVPHRALVEAGIS